MSNKRAALGKGLGALISGLEQTGGVPSAGTAAPAVRTSAPALASICEIPVDKISANPYQPRSNFDEQALAELADSIRQLGIIQPITVRPYRDRYEIIAGERRYRAYKTLGYETIPAIIADKDDNESANLALIENTQRENLNAIEEALAILKMMETQKKTQIEIARELGYNQSTVANKLRLLKLPEYIRDAIAGGEITERHGRALLNVDPDKQKDAFETIVRRGYNVKKTEEYLKAKNAAFLEGWSSSSDLIDAELNLAKVRTERIQMAYSYDVALAKLLEAAGVSDEFTSYSRRIDARQITFE